MGYLTQVTLHVDALHDFRKDPKEFGEAVLRGIDLAAQEHKAVSVPFRGYCNYITVEPMRHADHHAVFVSMGNCMSVIGAYENDFKDAVKRNPEFAKRLVEEAKRIVEDAETLLKESSGK